jgi:hypothetical protein
MHLGMELGTYGLRQFCMSRLTNFAVLLGLSFLQLQIFEKTCMGLSHLFFIASLDET